MGEKSVKVRYGPIITERCPNCNGKFSDEKYCTFTFKMYVKCKKCGSRFRRPVY